MRARLGALSAWVMAAACGQYEPSWSAPPAEPRAPAVVQPREPAAMVPTPVVGSSDPPPRGSGSEVPQRDETVTLGSLDAHLRGRGDRALLLLHGYGAPGDDLVTLGEELVGEVPGLRVVLPEAPQIWLHGGDGRAWYERTRADLPGQIASARAQLSELLVELERREHIPASRVTFAGFSMGATMSIELTLHGPVRPASLIVLSGNALPRFGSDWSAMRGLPVFVSHGRQDPILGFRHGKRIRDLATRGGAMVTFVEFDGGHAIPPEVIRELQAFLRPTP